jgi:ADP-heptose:LPS heptosyltransferase
LHYIVRNLTTFQIKKILIIRLSSLGDVILSEPLCRALRQMYPDAQIDFLVKKEFAEIVSLFGSITNVIPYDENMPGREYDAVLDIHNVLRSKRIRRKFGKKVLVINKRTFKRWLLVKFKVNLLKDTPDIIGRYFETAIELGVIDDDNAPRIELNGIVKQKRAALCPGAKHWNKRWLPERFAEVAHELVHRGYKVEIHGTVGESPIAEDVILHAGLPIANHCGKYSLTELARHLAECEVAITNDSGLMHLANAVGTRTISIFGPTVGEFGFYPRSEQAIIIENKGLSCRPCTTIGSDSCPKGHFECMKGIHSIEIIEKILL